MEIFTTMMAAVKSMELYLAEPHVAIMNVNVNDYFHVHHLIYAGKSIVAGYASVFLVPMWITLSIFFASIVNRYLQASDDALLHMAAKVIVVTVIYWNPKRENVVILCWILAQWDTNFQFFVDIYFIITVALYLIQYFGKEYEKAFTLICIMLCFDWCTDKYQGASHRNIEETIVTAFLFLGLSVLVMRPQRGILNYSYVCVFAAILAWLSYKFYRIASEHGFSVHSYDHQSGDWKDEVLNTIAVYVYDVLKYFSLYEPAVIHKSTSVKEFVKIPYEIILIAPNSNSSTLEVLAV